MRISSAIDAAAVSSVLGIETRARDLRGDNTLFLPQRVAIVGQGNTASTYPSAKVQVTSAQQAGETFGFGSPVHMAASQLLPANGDGVGVIPVTVYPLADHASGVAAAGDITPSGSATGAGSYRVRVAGILSEPFNVAAGDTVADICDAITAAINATVALPVTATDDSTEVGIGVKWEGASGNGVVVSVEGSSYADTGVTFAVTQPTGGSNNPDVTPALALVGDVWETLVVNCMDLGDDTTLDAFQTFGVGRWGATVRRPCVVFTATAETDVATAAAITDARKTDYVNSVLTAPGSETFPAAIAARMVARIAVLAANNPPFDYAGQMVTGVDVGTDGEQWAYADRELAVKAGLSTSGLVSGVLTMGDTVTCYHPDGDPNPAYRYVVDIVKLMQVLYNLSVIFAAPDWRGAPLIPDDQPTVNRSAKQPKAAVAAACAMLDQLGLDAIISDPKTAKANTSAEIDESNPKRLNLYTLVQLSGNTNVVSATLDFGFYFG